MTGQREKIFLIKCSTHNMGGTAELSPLHPFQASEYLGYPVEGTWYYFNRLYVPPLLRRQGIGASLMSQVIEWADANIINIINEANPYGDMNREDLIEFYARFGFIPINQGLLIRRPPT